MASCVVEESSNDKSTDMYKELYQLAKDNRKIEAWQVNIKVEIVGFFGLHL
jgi:hypothetical protein